MASEPRHPVRRLILATQYSMAGFAAAWRYEQAFRLEVLCFIVAAPAGWWLGDNGVERALLIGSLLLVLLVEVINSALEAVVDRIGLEQHVLSKRAKDLGSAAVFVALIIAAVVWGLILWDGI